MSLKTFARRYHQLLDHRACWWTHSRGSRELPLALVTVTLEPGADGVAIRDFVTREISRWMPVARDGLGEPPSLSPTSVAGLVLIESPSEVEIAIRKLLERPGVRGVRRTFALGSESYPEWFDERIREQAPDASSTGHMGRAHRTASPARAGNSPTPAGGRPRRNVAKSSRR